MNARKLFLPLLVALGCVALAALPTWGVAATHKHRSAKHPEAPLRIESIKVASKAGPLVLAVRANIHATVALTVNGKKVRHPFESINENVKQIDLRSTDGLRAGSNKLRLRSTRAGAVSTATRNVRVPGWALLANAGSDTATYVDTHTAVGTPPLPGAAPGGVDYSWRVVQKPRGANASLVDDGEPQPLLRADDPGTYVLQEEANPSTPGEPTAYDQVNVPVAADVPPSGLTLNTDKDNAISIGGQSYGKVSDDRIGYAIVERTTGVVVKSGDVGLDMTGIAALSTLADKYGAGDGSTNFMHYLMILSGGTGQSPGTAIAFASVMKKIGVALPSPETILAFNGRNRFSIVGIPGGPPDSATTRIPGGPEGAANSDAITGYLQRNEAVNAQGAQVYEYVSGENPEFDTKAAGSTGSTNVMTVDGKKFEASLPPGVTAGFHLVVLNSMTLQPIDNVGLSTNGSDGTDLGLQGPAANRFAQSTRTPGTPLVLVQSIGKPKAAGPVWETFVRQITRLGGNPQVMNALNGTAEYAFVGRAGSTAPPAESTTAYDKGPYPAPNLPPAHLIGVLARSRTSNFVPNVYSTPTSERPGGLVNIGLMHVAYQPPTAWPELAPGANRDEVEKAAHYICTKLNFCQPAASCDSVRECFWKKYDSDWGAKHADIIDLEYPGDSKGFTSAIFIAVKSELKEETGEVAQVHTWLAKLLAPLEQSSGSSYVDLQSIGNKVWESVQRPAADNSTSWILGLVSKVIAVGRIAPPPASNVAAALSGIFGLASYLSDKSGQPILGAQIKVKSSELANQLYARVQLARETTTALGMLITSDYGKLTTTYSHLDADWSPPTAAEADRALSIGAKQWFYEALIPTAYPYLIRASGVTNARALNCTFGDGNRRSWPNQPDQEQMNVATGYDTSGNPVTSDFFFTQGIGGGASPPASLGDEMFRPLEAKEPGLGIEKLQFFTARVFNGSIAHAKNNSNQCGVGWLPRHY
jgi:hypothetical protein